MAVVGSVMEVPENGHLVFDRLPVEQMSSRVYRIASVVYEMWAEKEPISPPLVLERLRQNGTLRPEDAPTLHDMTAHGFAAPIVSYVDALADVYGSRRAHAMGARVQQMIQGGTPLHTVLSYATSEVESITTEVQDRSAMVTPTLADILAEPDPGDIEWLLPDVLAYSDRALITAVEGGGKSVLLRQFALSLALGIDPFDPTRQTEPRRALLVDAENSRRQVVRSLRRMYGFASRHRHEGSPSLLAVESRQGGLDLTSAGDQGWLTGLVRQYRPSLVCIGPLYRITSGNLNDDESHRPWQRMMEPWLDQGISIVMEHHAPLMIDPTTGKRVLRPIGSSVLQRWFAQGVGIRTKKCERHESEHCRTCPKEGRIEQWRGSRDETYWPHYIRSPGSEVWWMNDLERE